jgi:signal peptidase
MLNLASLGGLVCLALVALAFTFNITLIMFKTGSMSPTIPAGSLSLVREIPATEIRVGDVVTVDRLADLPITHRVTSVAEAPSSAERIITMKGDANEAEDPFPYTVGSVRIVLASVPNLAYGVVWLSNPWVLAILTIGASTLVTWAFWPRSPMGEDPGAEEVPIPLPAESGNGSQYGLALLAIPMAVGFAMVSPVGTVTEDITEMGQLKIFSIGDHQAMAQMVPGEPVQWQVGVTADKTVPGEVRIDLSGSGNEELGLIAAIRSCDQRWTEGHCGGQIVQIQGTEPVYVDGTRRPLTAMTTVEERWLLFDLWIPEGISTARADEPARLQVNAFGAGVNVAASPGPVGTLPPTGASPFPSLFAATGAILLGIGMAGAAKKCRTRHR